MRSTTRSVRRAAVLAAALCAAATLPAASQAATLTSDTAALDYRAASGERNNVRIFIENGQVTFTDTVAFSTRGQCRRVTSRKARCGTSLRNGILRLGDGDDTTLIQVATPGFLHVLGGADDDTFQAGAVRGGSSHVLYAGDPGIDTIDYLAADRGVRVSLNDGANDGRSGDRDGVHNVENVRGSNLGDTIRGNAANNVIQGRGGGDVLLAGDGADTIVEGSSANGGDFISGGGGTFDGVTYKDRRNPVFVTLEGSTTIQNDGEAGEGDNVMNDVEVVTGGHGDDRMTGNHLPNVFLGGAGIDRISGQGGNDYIQPDAGEDVVGGNGDNDFLMLADGERDFASCGDGTRDTVSGDRIDFASECERGSPTVGEFRLSPRTLTARAGRTTTWRLAWTHPLRWTALDEVTLVLSRGGKRVGRVRFDQESGRLRVRGGAIRLRKSRTAAHAGGPTAKRVSVRLALRVARRYAGQTLTAKVSATDDFGNRQRPRRAGRIRVLAG